MLKYPSMPHPTRCHIYTLKFNFFAVLPQIVCKLKST